MDIEQRIKETQEGLLEKHDLVLNDAETKAMLDEMCTKAEFGSNDLEKEIVRMLMALHTLDKDDECNQVYYEVQERLDELRLSEGMEPIKDKLFSNAITNLLTKGIVDTVKSLNYKTKRLQHGVKINFNYKMDLHKMTQRVIQEWKLKKATN
jgi:hypothetical protein